MRCLDSAFFLSTHLPPSQNAEKETEKLRVALATAEARLDVTNRLSIEREKSMSTFTLEHSSDRAQITQNVHDVRARAAEMELLKVEVEVKSRAYEHRIADLQKQLRESSSGTSKVQQELFDHQAQAMSRASLVEQESRQQQQRLEIAAQTAQMNSVSLQNQVDILRHENLELSKRMTMINANPSISQYGEISRKIQELERRASDREAELSDVIKKTREASRNESRRLATLHEEELLEKDKQIVSFRTQLVKMMEKLRGSIQEQNSDTNS